MAIKKGLIIDTHNLNESPGIMPGEKSQSRKVISHMIPVTFFNVKVTEIENRLVVVGTGYGNNKASGRLLMVIEMFWPRVSISQM